MLHGPSERQLKPEVPPEDAMGTDKGGIVVPGTNSEKLLVETWPKSHSITPEKLRHGENCPYYNVIVLPAANRLP